MSDLVRQALQTAVRNLVTAISSSALYAPDHQQLTRLRGAALASLRSVLETVEEVALVVIDDELLVDGAPLDSGLYVERFVGLLRGRGIGQLKILRGVDEAELTEFARRLSPGGAGGPLAASRHIRLGRVEVRFAAASGTGTASWTDAFPADELARVMEVCDGVARHRRLRAAGLAELVDGFIAALRSQAQPLLPLLPLREMDEYTFTHSLNVCTLNLAQALSLGIDGPLLRDIGIAGLLHDIGKLFVPAEILTKPEHLDEDEWKLMRRHPHQGARCLLETPGVPALATIVAFEHHLKHDLSGYPAVPAGWRQHLCSELTTISDFFDALRTRRAYRDTLELGQVAGILLEKRGREFHPLLTRNFLLLLSRTMV